VIMSRFTINPEHRDNFENRFRLRAPLIDSEPGFIRNTVLRPMRESSDQHLMMTLWDSREDFET
ncbi:MAG: antibiotic biosynthesis monooxygenase, partial [Ghiorsea sp.]|nr:antibiotic biosynthesis monooxygenase [Ghiorsea sp.]